MSVGGIGRIVLAVPLLAGLATPAFASPVGTWEIEMRDSRYEVTLCGDGSQLCAELVWLGNGADTAENLPYLHTLLIDRAVPAGPGRWQGMLHLYGQSAAGTIIQDGPDQMTLTGCFLAVFCKSYRMYRYAE